MLRLQGGAARDGFGADALLEQNGSDLDVFGRKLAGIIMADYTQLALSAGPLDIAGQVGFPVSWSSDPASIALRVLCLVQIALRSNREMMCCGGYPTAQLSELSCCVFSMRVHMSAQSPDDSSMRLRDLRVMFAMLPADTAAAKPSVRRGAQPHPSC